MGLSPQVYGAANELSSSANISNALSFGLAQVTMAPAMPHVCYMGNGDLCGAAG